MKTKILLLLLVLISSFMVLGQNVTSRDGFSVTPPKFTGVKSTVPVIVEQQYPCVADYLYKKITYPEYAARTASQGTVVIGFTVTPNGGLSDINIINSVSTEIDDEVISALMTTNGMWTPAIINGEAVDMPNEISIAFKLSDLVNNDFTAMARRYYTKACDKLLVKQNPHKALRYFDRGIVLLPNDKNLLVMRGLTLYELGDKTGALRDWSRIKKLGGMEGSEYLNRYFAMKGYEEMSLVIGK